MGNCKSCAGHNDEEIGVDDLQGMKTNESSMNVGAKIHDVSYG